MDAFACSTTSASLPMAPSARGTVFFDYDGTLHDCMRLYGPAFRKACAWLVGEGLLSPRDYGDEEISRWLGWTVRDMWATFAPGLPEKTWRAAARIVGEEMDRLLDEGAGALFDGVPAVLDALAGEGFELVILSNCSKSYRDRHRREFALDRWMSAFYCAGEHPGLEKWQIYRKVAGDHPSPHVMVGDRFHDIEVAERSEIPSVGCAYGFGDAAELGRACAVASSPADIPPLVTRLSS